MENLKDIQIKFNKVIEHSQGMPKANTDKLFEDWLEAKRDFIEAFGGKLIWEWPEKVSFELDEKDKINRVEDFIDRIYNCFGNADLANFVEENIDGFFGNIVLNSYTTQLGTQIPKGMKLLRAFKFFETNKDVLNELQSIASMIIQENKIEGTLCLSVHPLDFISASENNHNWRSCHALDGDYRAGNLSYMMDNSTIMCYLKSSKDEILPNFPKEVPWNSKKWRVWLFFSSNWKMMFAGRQYPFTSKAGLDFVRKEVLPISGLGVNWSNWLSMKIKEGFEKDVHWHFRYPYIPINDDLIAMNDLVQNAPNSLHFNDLLSSSCYDPVYSFQMGVFYPKITAKTAHFRLGGEIKCLCCGKNTVELSESVMCNNCEMAYGSCDSDIFEICPVCNRVFIADEGVYIESTGESICLGCAEDVTKICECCGEVYYTDDMVWNDDTSEYKCKYCVKEEKEWQEELLERQRSLRD